MVQLLWKNGYGWFLKKLNTDDHMIQQFQFYQTFPNTLSKRRLWKQKDVSELEIFLCKEKDKR